MMFEASFSEVIEVMLTILLIYFGLKILFRLFGPLLLKFILRRIGKRFEKNFGQFDPGRRPEREEGIKNRMKTKKKQSSSKVVGEYIDYEEID